MFLMRKIESPSGIFPVELILRTLDVITSNVTGMKIRSKLGHVTVFKQEEKELRSVSSSICQSLLQHLIAGETKTAPCDLHIVVPDVPLRSANILTLPFQSLFTFLIHTPLGTNISKKKKKKNQEVSLALVCVAQILLTLISMIYACSNKNSLCNPACVSREHSCRRISDTIC